jgi:hypothetical protein
MKKIKLPLAIALTTIIVSQLLVNCKKDVAAPSPLKIMTVTTDGGIVLNGASQGIDIPLNSSVIVLFDKEVDTADANLTNVALKANGIDVPSTITADGSTVTIKPNANMKTGTNQTISVASTFKAKDGAGTIAKDFTFKTFGNTSVIPPQVANQLSYFSFSGNMNDEVGTHTPEATDIRYLTYTTDRFGFAGLTGDFNGSTSIVEVPNGDQYMLDNSLTISVWIKANSTKDGQFVLGLAARKGFLLELATDWSWVDFTVQYLQAGDFTESQDNQYQGSGLNNTNGGWQGTTFQDTAPAGVGLTYFKDKWAHVVYTYDAATKVATTYINGAKVIQSDFNLWPDVVGGVRTITGVKYAGNLTGGGNKLALGFMQGSQNRIITDSWADPADIYSNHFKGQMDDLRIFKVALTSDEVATLYAAEKP